MDFFEEENYIVKYKPGNIEINRDNGIFNNINKENRKKLAYFMLCTRYIARRVINKAYI